MMKIGRRKNLIELLIVLACLTAVAVVKWAPGTVSPLSCASEPGQALAARQQLAQAVDLSQGFQQVVKAVRPSVVSISSVKHVLPSNVRSRNPFGDSAGDMSPFSGNEFFERFFEQQMPRQGLEQRGLGSGVVVSSDGYVLTNNHVVQDADEVTVTLSDERQFAATVVGADAKTDVAVLKIEVTDLVSAPLGDSEEVEVGQWVLAVGSPFGLNETVTAGIVSAKGRADVGLADYEDFIQTDAAINPGNSGGPLLNLRGEVIGINTAIASRSGGYMGVGFAIPSNMAQAVMESIRKHGHVERGFLGAMIQDLSEDLAQSFGYDSNNGVLIGDVVPDGPAAKAGLKAGDIILRFQGKPVSSASRLRNDVASVEPGKKAALDVFRNGEKLTVAVEIERFDEGVVGTSGPANRDGVSSSNLGITVQTLTSELAEQLGYGSGEHGVVITNVEPGGLAARVGIRPRDVIAAVGSTPVTDAKQFRDAMDTADFSRGVRLLVKTSEGSRFVFLRAGR